MSKMKSFLEQSGINYDQYKGMLRQMGRVKIFPYVTENVEEFKLKMFQYKEAGIWDDYFLDTTIKGGTKKRRAPHEMIAKAIFDCMPLDIIEQSFKRFEYEFVYLDNEIKQYFNVYIVSREDGTIFRNRYVLYPKTADISLTKDEDDSAFAIQLLKNNKSFMTAEATKSFSAMGSNEFMEADQGEFYKEMTQRIYQEDIDALIEKERLKKESENSSNENKEELKVEETIVQSELPKSNRIIRTELKVQKVEEPVLKQGDLDPMFAAKEEIKRVAELNDEKMSFAELKKFVKEKFSELEGSDETFNDMLEDYFSEYPSDSDMLDNLTIEQCKEVYSYFNQ